MFLSLESRLDFHLDFHFLALKDAFNYELYIFFPLSRG